MNTYSDICSGKDTDSNQHPGKTKTAKPPGILAFLLPFTLWTDTAVTPDSKYNAEISGITKMDYICNHGMYLYDKTGVELLFF